MMVFFFFFLWQEKWKFKVTAAGIRDFELTRGDTPQILSDQVSFSRTNPFLSTFESRRERGCAPLQPHHSFLLKVNWCFHFHHEPESPVNEHDFFFRVQPLGWTLRNTLRVYLIRTSVCIEVTGNVALRTAMTDLSSADNWVKLIWWFARQKWFPLSAETHQKGVIIVSGWEWRCEFLSRPVASHRVAHNKTDARRGCSEAWWVRRRVRAVCPDSHLPSERRLIDNTGYWPNYMRL